MNKKIELFREQYLFNKEEILKSLGLFVEHERKNELKDCSSGVLINRIHLYEKLISMIKKSKLPELSELWWFYEYQFLVDRMELNLCQADDIEIEENEISGMTIVDEQNLLVVECEYLTIDQYAKLLQVKSNTVEKWIQHGKLKHAKRKGSDWYIPDTEDKPRRVFSSIHYIIEKDSHFNCDEFPMLSLCESVFIFQDEEQKTEYICHFDNYEKKFKHQLSLTKSEVERLEYVIIESGKARVDGIIQYVPVFSKQNISEN